MKKFLIIPSYFIDISNKKDFLTTAKSRIEVYLKRSLFFFQTKENFLVLYPEDKQGIGGEYARAINSFLGKVSYQPMKEYIVVDSDSNKMLYGHITNQLAESIFSEDAKETPNIIVIVNASHVSQLITAIRKIFDVSDKLKFKPSDVGFIGHTEALFFDKDDENSIEYLRFHSHLDFFIPKQMDDFSESMMKAGKIIHDKIKKKGHTEFLTNLAELIA